MRNLLRNLGRDHTVILSTHILQEVQAVCDRIVIINKGKIVADEQTENITRVVESNRRFQLKICGPQKEVLSMLKAKPGIIHAELLSGRDGDAYTFNIETEVGVDVRKSLFYTLAEKNWPIIGIEALGMSLEDIFVAIVDQTDTSGRYGYERKGGQRAPRRVRAEHEVAKTIAEKRTKNAETEFSALFGDDEDKK